MTGVTLEIYGRTDLGVVRDANEDSFAAGDLDGGTLWDGGDTWRRPIAARGPLLVVCDGMGGADGGEVASAIAVRVLWEEMRDSGIATADRAVYARLLRRAVRAANRKVFEESRREQALRGMGTTLSAAGLAGSWLVLAQVGDSRAYVRRGATLTQVTRDQSIVSALVHAGRITEEEARRSLHANMILQALGVSPNIEVSLSVVELRRGDVVLLCSDGLHGPLGDSRLQQIVCGAEDLQDATDRLIGAAREAGGPDNITALMARFAGEGLRPAASQEDLPRFAELDPGEEGDRGITSTSYVARRLAARAGLVDDPGPPVVPATGQHAVLRESQILEAREARGLREARAVKEATEAREARRVAKREAKRQARIDAKMEARREARLLAKGAPPPDLPGPAAAALAERGRVGLVAWVVLATLALAIIAAVLLDLL